jgi:hypothetical protein
MGDVVYSAFISYASADQAKADEICATLEARGFRCWIAWRDARGGHDYGVDIIEAIRNSRCCVLVLSEAANRSQFVRREVERAVSYGKPVYPVRVEEVLPSPGLELFIAGTHWIDAWQGALAAHAERLAREMGAPPPTAGTATTPVPSTDQRAAAPRRATARIDRRTRIVGVVAGVAAFAFLGNNLSTRYLSDPETQSADSAGTVLPDSSALAVPEGDDAGANAPAPDMGRRTDAPTATRGPQQTVSSAAEQYRESMRLLQDSIAGAMRAPQPASGTPARGVTALDLDTVRKEHFRPVVTFADIGMQNPVVTFAMSPGLAAVFTKQVRSINGSAPVESLLEFPLPLPEGDLAVSFRGNNGETVGPFTWRFDRRTEMLKGMKQGALGSGPFLSPTSGIRPGWAPPLETAMYYCRALRRYHVGTAATKLDQVVNVTWNVERQQCQMEPAITIPLDVPALFAQIEFFDGTRSDVRAWRAPEKW